MLKELSLLHTLFLIAGTDHHNYRFLSHSLFHYEA